MTDDAADFFVSYTEADSGWAEWIAWQLEAAGYKVVIQKWDFKAGSNFVLEMNRAASTAKKTLLVLSPAFLESGFAASEWAAGFAKDPQGLNRNVIPVLISPTKLDGLLSQIVYVNLVGLSRDSAATALIAAVEPGRSKPSAEPAFPGAVSVPGLAPTVVTTATGLSWSPTTSTLTSVPRESVLPRSWSNDVYVAFEVSLVPAEVQTLRVGQLEAMADEFVATGRAAGLFSQGGAVENGATADVAFAKTQDDDAAGLLVTRQGQRTAWITLPHDLLGSVLDPEQIRPRVSRVLQLLFSVDLPLAVRYGFTARLHPSRSLMVGDASTVGARSSASMGMGYEERFPVPMPDNVQGDAIAAHSDELAEELVARVVAAMRS
ncbi:toll/interleukin-1 receptor domain-containing protein [Microbacterium sp. NPDC008134]|uniref:toll/interleukin-1 receptor domain-containing protein n=1 Tax=Microbacterium sp. NPDC008134 TaxID=3364183 RepID=UPI0036E85989